MVNSVGTTATGKLFLRQELPVRRRVMGGLIYLIGLIVVVLFILSFLGLR